MTEDNLPTLVEKFGIGALLSRHVLVVDDDAPNLAVLSAILEGADYVVHEAGSGFEALEIAGREPIDVVIADQRMPQMTGVQLLERLRRMKPDVAGIVLTAFTDSPALIAAINRARAFRFLTKPWDPEDVLTALEHASEYVYQRRAITRLVDELAQRNEDLASAMDELRTAQRQLLHLERLGTMGRLTAGITHDLQNLLVALDLLQEEFVQTDLEDEPREILDITLAGIRNLLDTVDAMNQFARGGEMVMIHVPTEPALVVGDAVRVMRMDMEFRRREVEVAVDEDLPRVSGDRQKLTQVVVNLIRNAIQATTMGQGVKVEARCAEPGRVVLAVEDSGHGVAAHLREKLFEPFVSTKGDQGMGMGLHMARDIAETHGGTLVLCEGTLGGARFELTLPAMEAH